MTNTLPFRADPVVDDQLRSPNDDRLRLVPNDQNWVIRFIPPGQYAAIPQLSIQTRAVHDELEQFAIRLPPRAYLEVEEEPGRGRTSLIVAARVNGESLAHAAASHGEALVAAEAAISAVLRYYSQKFVTRTPYVGDLRIGQFMWGTHLHSATPGAWMIDLDAGTSCLTSQPEPLQIALLHWWIGETANSAIEVEVQSGERLKHYRRMLDELESSRVFSHPSATGRIDRMRAALASRECFEPNEEWVQPLFD